MFLCRLRYDGVDPTHPGTSFIKLQNNINLSAIGESGIHPTLTVCDGPRCTERLRQAGEDIHEMGHWNWLLVSNRNRVVISCSLHVIHTFPAHLWRRSWRWVLWRILDAFWNWLSGLLLWKNGFPVLASDSCLEQQGDGTDSRQEIVG